MDYNNYSTEIWGYKIEVQLGQMTSYSPWFIKACAEYGITLKDFIINDDNRQQRMKPHWWMKINNSIYSIDDTTDSHKLIDYFEGFKNDEQYFHNEGEDAETFGKSMFDIELENLVNNEFEYLGFKFENVGNLKELLNNKK